MKHILITRPEPGATETAARLAALGFVPVLAPVLSIEATKFPLPQNVAATLLTSRNALTDCLLAVHDKPVFAVGAATTALAKQAGFQRVHNANGDAASLVRLVMETISPDTGPLLLPVGEGQGCELATTLRDYGFHVLRRVAYRALAVKSLPKHALTLLSEGQFAQAMFFSGETSRHFVRLLTAEMLNDAVIDMEAVAISERAAMPLRPLHWRRIKIAAKPNQDAMLALLEND